MALRGRPPTQEDVSYFKEMLGHPANLGALCGSLVLGSVALVASGVMGWALLPMIGYAGAAGIASLFVPDSPVFREYVDRKKRAEARERHRQYLLDEIRRRAGDPDAPGGGTSPSDWSDHWERYRRMRERFESLARVAAQKGTSLTAYDLEKLDDATVDFLRLFHGRLAMRERIRSNDPDELRSGIKRVERQVEGARTATDRMQLEKAKADLEKLLQRHESLKARDTAAAAALLSASDTFEEVYHHILTNPHASGMSDYLEGVADRFAIEEELSLEVERELGELKARPEREAEPPSQAARRGGKTGQGA